MARRHMMTHYGMTPDDYRAKWNLPRDYPMVAPDYAEKRRVLAKAIGLGTQGRGGGRKPAAKPAAKAAPTRRARTINACLSGAADAPPLHRPAQPATGFLPLEPKLTGHTPPHHHR